MPGALRVWTREFWRFFRRNFCARSTEGVDVAKCDPNTILAKPSAACYQCLDRGSLALIKTQLLCNWLGNVSPPPVTTSYLLQQTGFRILQENGSGILI